MEEKEPITYDIAEKIQEIFRLAYREMLYDSRDLDEFRLRREVLANQMRERITLV